MQQPISISISIAAIVTVLMTQTVQAKEVVLEQPASKLQINRPATTVKEWLAQSSESPIQVTGVRLNATETGLEVILETTGQLVSPITSVVGNALIIDIPNAVLVSPDGLFQTANPVEGIAFTSVLIYKILSMAAFLQMWDCVVHPLKLFQ